MLSQPYHADALLYGAVSADNATLMQRAIIEGASGYDNGILAAIINNDTDIAIKFLKFNLDFETAVIKTSYWDRLSILKAIVNHMNNLGRRLSPATIHTAMTNAKLIGNMEMFQYLQNLL